MHHANMHPGYMHYRYMHHGYMHHGYVDHGYVHHTSVHHTYIRDTYMWPTHIYMCGWAWRTKSSRPEGPQARSLLVLYKHVNQEPGQDKIIQSIALFTTPIKKAPFQFGLLTCLIFCIVMFSSHSDERAWVWIMINSEWFFEYFQSPKWAWYGVGAAYRNQIRWEAGETDRRSLVKVYGRTLGQNQYVNFKIGGKLKTFGRYLEMWLDKRTRKLFK